MLLRSGQLASEASGLEARVTAAAASLERLTKRTSELDAGRMAVASELASLTERAGCVRLELERCESHWQAARQKLAGLEAQQQRCQRESSELQLRQAAARERAAVLEELEQRQEGVGAGVKDLLRRAQEAGSGPLSEIRGIVADALQAQFEFAPLIDIALGQRADFAVVASTLALTQLLESHGGSMSGRVGLLALDGGRATGPSGSVRLESTPGVVGRADTFVECAVDFVPLKRRLLGRTWIVETLTVALELAASAAGEGLSFVARSGEMVASDGTVYVGPALASGGLVSRRSELRDLADRMGELTVALAAQQQLAEQLAGQIESDAADVQSLGTERERLQAAAADLRLLTGAAEERSAQLNSQHAGLQVEITGSGQERDEAARSLERCRGELAEVEASLADAQASLAHDERQGDHLERQRQQRIREATLAKVELAKSEQRLDHLQSRLRQLQQDQDERQRAVTDGQTLLLRSAERAREAERLILEAESQIAELFLQKESMASEIVGLIESRETLRTRRAELLAESQKLRAAIRRLETELHAEELSAGEIRHERGGMADRLREDYNIELSELEHKETDEEQHVRAEVEEEIASLRRKITNTGSVNLEALDELDSLETRFNDLSTQFRDLSGAKNSLQQIIEKINVDSRRLFSETLDTVRGHFQTLFRKLFGGGQADIIIEDEVDILESGLEIVARPPGKEPRSISLLSGGEKTLTCVALLLAIFRSKPSPFCVLDEVDAALDEANIGRFVAVLQEFLAWTQFIVVTHSKKTMTCAGALYGVTMQESGISKRVSVRFEDVSDNGEILRTRDESAEAEASASAAATEQDETQAA
ncbi:MAG: hypothetical protein K8T25_12110 [Planctomycetia bacterium]|nr:hypothetical protein [Planctomycetia bacterium]